MNLTQAMNLVSFDSYAKENGKMFTQSTHPDAVRKGLEMLSPEEGQRVLEIGTGSGYSTALLAELVGTNGRVTSIDIDPNVTNRASSKLSIFPHVQCVNGNGWKGVEENAPYDRIIAWTSPDQIPFDWEKQLNDGGYLVAPFPVRPVVGSTVTFRLQKQGGTWKGESVSEEGYIRMTDDPSMNNIGQEVYADVKGDAYWFGSMRMKEKEVSWAAKLEQSEQTESPFDISGKELRAYLLATFPTGYTYGFMKSHGYLIGFSTPEGFAFLNFHYPNKWVVSDEHHASILSSWVQDWEEKGRPSYEQLVTHVHDHQLTITL